MANEEMRKWLITLRSRGFGASQENEYTFVLSAKSLTEDAVNKVRKKYSSVFCHGWLNYQEVVVVNIILLEG